MTFGEECNCGTCTNQGTSKCPYDVICYNEDGCDFIQPFKRSEEFMKFTKACGLLCHPRAREVLMGGELAELKRMAAEKETEANDEVVCEINQISADSFCVAYRRAINLILYGVKKG